VAARSKARKRALDVLFEAELRGLPVLELLAERMSLGDRPTPEYAAEVVRGVAAHRAEIDKLIAGNAVGWTLERMPSVDRNVLRIGVWELLWADDVPDGVAISEAVALAQDLSTDGSPAFVNGLLAKVAATKAAKPTAGPEAGLAPEPEAGPELPDGTETAASAQSPADAEVGDSAEPSADSGPASNGEPAGQDARPRARSAGLVKPTISSVLRPAPDPAESSPGSED
jgi:N utilization substance protein B